MLKQSYWNGNGQYQHLYDLLNEMIPVEGAVPDARGKNRALEKVRVAANCYHDLFNNGLCNRAAQFRRVFGFGGTVISNNRFNHPHYEKILEDAVDEIVLKAAIEQGLYNPLVSR